MDTPPPPPPHNDGSRGGGGKGGRPPPEATAAAADTVSVFGSDAWSNVFMFVLVLLGLFQVGQRALCPAVARRMVGAGAEPPFRYPAPRSSSLSRLCVSLVLALCRHVLAPHAGVDTQVHVLASEWWHPPACSPLPSPTRCCSVLLRCLRSCKTETRTSDALPSNRPGIRNVTRQQCVPALPGAFPRAHAARAAQQLERALPTSDSRLPAPLRPGQRSATPPQTTPCPRTRRLPLLTASSHLRQRGSLGPVAGRPAPGTQRWRRELRAAHSVCKRAPPHAWLVSLSRL